MSYKERLSDLDRANERSLTQQLVELFSAAIERARSAPGEQLPPTRELAELAGVNHLTAVRAYRRLRELGLVTAQVGRGTFVRGAAGDARSPPLSRTRSPGSGMRFPTTSRSYGDRVLAEMHSHATVDELIPLSVGYPSARIFPIDAIRAATAAVMASEPERAMQYTDIQGVPELAAADRRALRRARRAGGPAGHHRDQRGHPGPEPGDARDPAAR